MSPPVTCRVPGALVVLIGSSAWKVALAASDSVNTIVSPSGSVSEATVTVTVSITVSLVLRSQSTTRTRTLSSQAKEFPPIAMVPSEVQVLMTPPLVTSAKSASSSGVST